MHIDGFSGSFTASASLEKALTLNDVVQGEEKDDRTRRAAEAREVKRWGLRLLMVDSDGGGDEEGDVDDDDDDAK